MAKSRRSHGFWNGQRVLAVFLIVTALVEIISTVSEASWVLHVTQILQIRHPYLSDTARLIGAGVGVVWWVIVLLVGVYLLVDKNFWEDRIFEGRRL